MSGRASPRSSEQGGPACRCGYGIDHHMVSAEPDYSIGAWFAIVVGISMTPRQLRYRCRRCEQEFFRTTDPAALKAHV